MGIATKLAQITTFALVAPMLAAAGREGGMAQLNRYTFHGNLAPMVDGERDTIWFVQFCFNWSQTCQNSTKVFRHMASQLEAPLNDGAWLWPRVRFAEVECSTDIQLCKDAGFGDYPMVARYGTLLGSRMNPARSVITGMSGARLKEWPKRLAAFVHGNLEEHCSKELLQAIRSQKKDAADIPVTMESTYSECDSSKPASCCQGSRCTKLSADFVLTFLVPLLCFVLLAKHLLIINSSDLGLSALVLLVASGTAAVTSYLLTS